MAQAIVARENGDDYQRLVLWNYINDFISKTSDIETIFHEFDEVKGFDDIIIKYKNPIIIGGERSVEKEYVQVKFHQYQSDFLTIDNLIQPEFINSKTQSFLGKLSDAYKLLGDDYSKCLFTLYTPFDIDQNDTLYEIVDNHSRMITKASLFDGTTRTKRAQDKNKILKHLNIEEEELKIILSRVRFYKGHPFPELIDLLNIYLGANGLVSISNQTVCNSYISLAKNWLSGNKLELSKEFIMSECKAEGLISPPEEIRSRFAIKTFVNNTSYLNQQEIETLDLSEVFDGGKYLKKEYEWESIYQKIKSFCAEKENSGEIYSVHLECALTIAFLSGRVVNPKSGLCAYPMQKTLNGIVSWRCCSGDDADSFNNLCLCDEYIVNDNGMESVLMISITNNIEPDVMEYLQAHQVNVGKVYHIKSKNHGPESIKNGVQCWNVSEFIAKLLGSRTRREKITMTHVFVSAPSALMFSIGKLSLNMGKLTLYEHDMKYTKEDVYIKSAVFPMKGE